MNGQTRTEAVERAVSASNDLTARWVRSIDRQGFVVSGACVWPLLAALAAGAKGAARDELQGAAGISAADGLAMATGLLGVVEAASADAAMGIWIRDSIVLDPAWVSGLPLDAIGRLVGDPGVDGPVMDAWVRDRTHGILREMPVKTSKDTLLILAAAMAVRLEWEESFRPVPLEPPEGPWAGRRLIGLSQTTYGVERISVTDSPIGALTMLACEGRGSTDVHLVAGPDGAAPGEALSEAMAALAGGRPLRRGLEIVDGEVVPALRVATTEGRKRDPYATIRTPAFDITNHVVLTDAPDLFGLRTAMDAGSGHFPDVSTAELYVQEAAQAARARFDALGFEAAAVTAVKMGRIATLATSSFAVRVFDLTFDRPFGFLAVDRRSGLVLFAGWVNDPEPWADPEP